VDAARQPAAVEPDVVDAGLEILAFHEPRDFAAGDVPYAQRHLASCRQRERDQRAPAEGIRMNRANRDRLETVRHGRTSDAQTEHLNAMVVRVDDVDGAVGADGDTGRVLELPGSAAFGAPLG